MSETEKFNFIKFVTGFVKPLNGVKAIVLGAWLALIFFLGLTVYRAYFKKQPPTTSQQAEQITNHYYQLEPKQTFGCISMRVFREKFKEVEEVKK